MAVSLTQQQKIQYSALADQIYVRDDLDQALDLNDIATGLTDIDPQALDVTGTSLRRSGDYYYSDNGFVARVIEDNGQFIVVFRGVDAADIDIGDLLLGTVSANNPNEVDAEDIQNSIALGGGTAANSQYNDALNLTKAVLTQLAGGDTSKVTVVGQSLGGGLAALVSTGLDVKGFALAPAPFENQLDMAAHLAAIEDLGWSLPEFFFDLEYGDQLDHLEEDGTFSLYDLGVKTKFFEDLYAQRLATNQLETIEIQDQGLSEDAVSGAAIGVFADHFAIDEKIDLGPGTTDSEWSLHSPSIHALAIKTKDSIRDIADLFQEDGTLRWAFFDEVGVSGALDHARVDPDSTTTSKVGASGPTPAILIRALWKSFGNATPNDEKFYNYFHDFFTNTIAGGAAAEGLVASNEGADALSLHSGVVKIALGTLRDAVEDTASLAELRTNLGGSWNFGGGTVEGEPLTDHVILDLAEVTSTHDDQVDDAGTLKQSYGVRDINTVAWDRVEEAVSAAGIATADITSTIQRVLDTDATRSEIEDGDKALPAWEILVAQAGADGFTLTFDASATGAATRSHIIFGGDQADTLTGSADHDVISGGGRGDTLTGGAGNDVILGERGRDDIKGQADNDFLFGGDGKDTIEGGAGNDEVYGGEGHDDLFGDDGNDVILGGDGADLLVGGDGNDTLVGGAGADMLFAGSNTSTTQAAPQTDTLEGGAGNDLLMTIDQFLGNVQQTNFLFKPVPDGLGIDLLIVSAGDIITFEGVGTPEILVELGDVSHAVFKFDNNNYVIVPSVENLAEDPVTGNFDVDKDIIFIDGNPLTLDDIETSGTRIFDFEDDYLNEFLQNQFLNDFQFNAERAAPIVKQGTDANDNMTSEEETNNAAPEEEEEEEEFHGGDGDDIIYPKGGDDKAYGEAGNDTLIAGSGRGDDLYDGGTGNDTIVYSSTTAGVTVDLAAGTGTGTEVDNDTIQAIENVVGGSGADTITGDGVANILTGGGGNDTLDGGAGDDFAIFAGNVADYTISTVTGTTTVTDNDAVADGDDGVDTLTNIETLRFVDRDVAINGTNNAPMAMDDSGSTDEDQVLSVPAGGLLTNDIEFDSGDTKSITAVNGVGASVGTQITLGSSALLTVNADGSYSYDPNGVFDALAVGDTATDSFVYTVSDGTVGEDATVSITIDGTSAAGLATLGTATDETFIGDDGDDVFDGGDGNDDLQGNAGDDFLIGSGGNDTLSGGAGDDVVVGGIGDDTLTGGDGLDTLNAGAGVDIVNGGLGDDTLAGGAGNDTLDGGAGADVATYAGNIADYTISTVGGTTTVTDNDAVTDGDDGVDTLTNVEKLRFADHEIFIDGTNNVPVAVDDTGSTDKATALSVPVGGLLSNDLEFDSGDTKTISAVNGNLANVGVQITLASGALLTVNADGSYIYDPNGAFDSLGTGQSSNDGFTYTVEDTVGASDDATVSLTINGPAANTVTGTAAGETLNGTAGADLIDALGGDDTLNGLAGDDSLIGGAGNDTLDGGADSDTAVFAGNRADYTVVDNGGSLTVTDTDAVAAGDDGTDTLTNVEALQFADATVDVSGALDRVVAAQDLTVNSTLSGTGTFALVDDVANGSVTVNPDGTFSFVPAAGFTGTDRFAYSVNDGGNTVTHLVDVEVLSTEVVGGLDIAGNTFTTNIQSTPAVSAFLDGSYILAWQSLDQDGSSWGVYGQRFNADGSANGAEFRINTTINNLQLQPSVAVLNDGGYVATWASFQQVGSFWSIYGQRYDAGGNAVGGEFRVNASTSHQRLDSHVTALDGGGFFVSWSSFAQDGSNFAIVGQRYDAAGSKLGTEFLINSHSSNNQADSYSIGLSDGGFVVVWSSDGQDGSGLGVYGQRHNAAGAKVGGEFRINTHTTDAQDRPSAALLSDGSFVVTWTSANQDGSGEGIYAQRYNSAAVAVGGEFQVNTTIADAQVAPITTGLSTGGFVIVWRSFDTGSSTWFAHGQQYDAAGNTIGAEFVIGAIAGGQHGIVVDALPDGRFVVAFDGTDADGSGVFTKILGVPDLTLSGAGGDDFLAGGAGDDTLSGGGGTDTAVYAGNFADYALDHVAGTLIVDDTVGGGGTDSLLDVETLQFADVTLDVSAPLDRVVVAPGESADGTLSGTGVFALAANAAHGNVTVNADGTFGYVPAAGFGGTDKFAYNVTDGGVTVARVMLLEAPSISEKPGVQVNTFTTSVQDAPSVASFADGSYVVAWQSLNQDGSSWGVYGQQFNADGSANGSEFRINTTTNNLQMHPSVAVLVDGSFVAIWQSFQQVGSFWSIYGQRYDSSGNAVGGEFRVNASTAHQRLDADVTALDGGGFFVSWSSFAQDGSNFGVVGQRYNAAGSKLGTEFLINSHTTNNQAESYSIGLSDGGFLVVWSSDGQDGSGLGIYGQRHNSAGAKIGGEFRINTHTADSQQAPKSAILNDDGFIVVWQSQDQDGDDFGIYGQRYDSSAVAVGGEFRVNTTVAGSQTIADVTGLQDGGYVVVWKSFDPVTMIWSALGQRYDSSGTADGGEFFIGQIADGHQGIVVDSLASGGFVVVSNGADSDGLGVFTRVYDSANTVHLTGGDGNDLLVGGAGDDVVDGGAGNDIAVFAGNRADYTISTVGGITTVTDNDVVAGGDDGTDTVTNVETLQFADGTIDVSAPLDRVVAASGTTVAGSLSGIGTFALVDDVSNGSVTVNADGTFSYVPAIGFVGTDQFAYSVTDGGNTVTRLVAVDALELTFEVAAEQLVNTFTGDSQGRPDIAVLDDGGHVIVWESFLQDGSLVGIYGQRFDGEGDAIGSEFRANTTTSDEQRYRSVTALEDGGFLVVWASNNQDGSSHGVYGQRFDASGATVGGEFRVNTTTASTQIYPDAIGLQDGGFLVTWDSYPQDGSHYGVYFQKYDSSGSLVGGETLINVHTTNAQWRQDLASLAGGGFVATWNSDGQDGSGDGVYGRVFDSTGSATSAEFKVNTYTTSNQNEQLVAALADGGFVITWTSAGQDGTTSSVYGQRYDSSGNAIGGEFRINTHTAGEQISRGVAGLANGGFVATWQSNGQDGAGWGVYGQRYDVSGNTVGDEFLINTTTSGNQTDIEIEATPDGGFIVAWQSDSQDGSGNGIVSRIYSPSDATLDGGAGNDVLASGIGNDTLTSGDGNDQLIGGAGDDTLDGGTGSDTAVFAGNRADYTVVDSAGVLTVTDTDLVAGGDDGTDTLTNVEMLQFADGLVDVSAPLDRVVAAGGTTVAGSLSGTGVFALADDVANGAVTVNADGTFSYVPDVGFFGTDRFAYSVTEGGNTETRLVAVEVPAVSAFDAGAEIQVNTGTVGDQTEPDIAILSNGGHVVVWQSPDGSSTGIYGQRYNADGTTAGSEFRVNTTTSDVQGFRTVTALDGGGFVVSWSSLNQSGTIYAIYAQQYDALGATVGSEFKVNTTNTVFPGQIQSNVIGLNDGGYLIFWSSFGQDGDHYGVYGQRYDATGTAVGGEFQVNTYTTSAQHDPDLAVLANGDLVVTWTSGLQDDGVNSGIYGQIYNSAGAVVVSEFLVNTTTPDTQHLSAVTALEDGGFAVAWTSLNQDGSVSSVHGQRYDSAGAKAGVEFQINTTTADAQARPELTGLADGGFVATWESNLQDGSGFGVYGQRYDAEGMAVGGEFQISTTTTGAQSHVVVTALADGGFLAAWQTENLDGSGFGIAKRVYSPSDTVLTGGEGNDILAGGSGDDTLDGGVGADTLFGGTGQDGMTGGIGNDTFVFKVGDHADQITDFQIDVDLIDVSDFGVTQFANLTIDDDLNGDAVIDLSGGDELKLIGVATASLDENDFTFA